MSVTLYRWFATMFAAGVIATLASGLVQAQNNASKSATQARSDRAVNALTACFSREYPNGDYTSADGGQSSLRLLAKCSKQWEAASVACVALGGGDSKEDCNMKTGILAQAWLKLRDAGFPDR